MPSLSWQPFDDLKIGMTYLLNFPISALKLMFELVENGQFSSSILELKLNLRFKWSQIRKSLNETMGFFAPNPLLLLCTLALPHLQGQVE